MRQTRTLARLFYVAMTLTATAFAGGPRWSSGSPYFTNSDGKPVVWFTTNPLYFTDPGDLSASVDHAAADALVAEAASVWNVNVSSIVLAQGGTLAEHVSGANVSLSSSGLVFPADVQPSNSAAIQIAVLYDSDGSVTDLLLGSGASDPGNCRQTAVTESVDSIAPSNLIQHALLVLNGRCTGPDLELQLEMKYRLIRAFGRVLGLAWSQANDNVFTGSPQASNAEELNWPLMHPVDLLCGPYAYQCLEQPFTLRPDDLASIAGVYPSGVTGNGKIPAYSVAGSVSGVITFSNGQGMQGVNVLVRRYHSPTNTTDAYDLESSVSGYRFQRLGGNPVTPKGTSLAESFGWPYQLEGTFDLAWIPIPTGEVWDNMIVSTEPVNSLYTGQYAVGPYTGSQVAPSGGPLTVTYGVIGRGAYATKTLVATSGAGACTSGTDGTEIAPADVAPNGEWTGTLCGYGHTAWSGFAVQAGRSLTVEVMALDEQGIPTSGKVQPVIGLWASTDAPGTLPTVGSVAASMNTATLGLTALTASNPTTRRLRLGFGDMRGDGRPDYTYTARVLYADSISPASVALNGGQVTISGMGFRPGNTVTINGVAAQVLSWSPTAIVAIAPAMTAALTADAAVTDLSTGGQTTMSAVLTYGSTALPDILSVVSSPASGAYATVPATAPFAVRVLLADGVTPAVGAGVTVSATNATLGACSNTSTCILTTDNTGNILTPVTPTSIGTVNLLASIDTATVTASFATASVLPDILELVSLPPPPVYAGIPAPTPFAIRVTLPNGLTPAGHINATISAAGATLGACAGLSSCSLITDSTGLISTTVTPTDTGTVSLQATAAGGVLSASFGVLAMPPDILRVTSLPANGSYVGTPATAPLGLRVLLGNALTPAAGAMVKVTATQAMLNSCASSTCTLTADATGSVFTTITPTSQGTVSVSATAGGGTLVASFTAQAVPPDTVRLISIPANGTPVGTPAAVPFAFQVLLGDGTTPAASASATVTATGGLLGACAASTCTITADAQGMVSTTVTPTVFGTISLKASAGSASISVSFTSVVNHIRILSQPTTLVYVGVPAATPFSAQVLLADGVTPAAGAPVSISATLAGLSTCAGASSCILTADASGTVSAIVIPHSPGIVTFQLTSGSASASASFEALAMPPDYLKILSAPTGSAYLSILIPTPFTVQVFLGDRITLATGILVKLQSPSASLTNCGTACYFTTDANGTISTTVTPFLAGPIVLTAIAGGVTITSTFTGVLLPPDILTVLSLPPDGSSIRQAAPTPFSVKVLYGDGATIAAGVPLAVTATNATLTACGRASCVVHANPNGVATTQVTPIAVGPVVLTSTAGGTTITPTFLAALPSDVLTVLSLPANGSTPGRPAAALFKVKAVLPGTTTPDALIPITLTATNATLGACAAATCVLTADAIGAVASTVTPAAVGPVALTASAGGGTVSTSFTAAADTLSLVSVPADGSYAGVPAATPFSIQAMLGDRTGPDIGAPVTLIAIGATFAACGLPTCVVAADSNGRIATALVPAQPGTVTLAASAGGSSISASFTAANPIQLASVSQSTEYTAAEATLNWNPQVTVTTNGLAVTGTEILWTVLSGPVHLSAPESISDSIGMASVEAVIGPLGPGETASAAACAFVTICTTFSVQAVDDSDWSLASVSGGSQNVEAGDTLQPVILRIADGAGHPIAGVSVAVHQVVNEWVNCPPSGRCPIAATLGSSSATLVSDASGLVTVTPLDLPGVAEVTQIVAVAGPDGSLSLSLSKMP